MIKNSSVADNLRVISLQKLKDTRAGLITKIAEMKADATRSDDNCTDVLDVAANVESQNRLLSELRREEARLLKVEFALRNFSDFGYCIDCGEDIDERRLGIDPSICRCIDCQSSREIQSKHIA
ncbi:RNA polymerase-binding transcription factor DksA [compost metagenome]